MNRHTPGPWSLKSWHESHIVTADGDLVASAYADKNRKLIAAAPDMYDALQMAAPCLDSYLNGQGAITADELDAALTAITRALARASL